MTSYQYNWNTIPHNCCVNQAVFLQLPSWTQTAKSMISTIHSNKIFPVLTFITVDQSFCLPCWLDFEVGHNLQLQHVEVPRPAGNFLWAHRQTMRTLQKELENTAMTWQRSVFFDLSCQTFWVLQRHLACGLNIFYFHLYLGKWSNLTNIFQMGGSTTNQLFFL